MLERLEKELLLKLKIIIRRDSYGAIVEAIDSCIDKNDLEPFNKIYNDVTFNNNIKNSLVDIISSKLKNLKVNDKFYLIDSNGYFQNYPVEEFRKCGNGGYHYEGMYSSTSDDGDGFYFKELPTKYIKGEIISRLHLEVAKSIDAIDNSRCADWLKEALKVEINKDEI